METFFLWFFFPSLIMVIFSAIPHGGSRALDHGLHGIFGHFHLHIPGVHAIHAGHVGHIHTGAGHIGHNISSANLEIEMAPINGITFFAFTGIFGGLGYIIMRLLHFPGFFAFLLAFFAAYALAWIIWQMMKYLMRQSSSSIMDAYAPIGRQCTVSVEVQPNKVGEVRVQIGRGNVSLLARTNKEETIPKGSTATITSKAEGSIYVVE